MLKPQTGAAAAIKQFKTAATSMQWSIVVFKIHIFFSIADVEKPTHQLLF